MTWKFKSSGRRDSEWEKERGESGRVGEKVRVK